MAGARVTKEELVASFAAGVVLHLAVFRHGEWDAHSFTLLEAAAALQLALALFAALYQHSPTTTASLSHALAWAAAALAGLAASILAYRASPLHRLHRFPGPFAARLSQLYMTSRRFLPLLPGGSGNGARVYEDVRALHAAHGDIVRVGPSELSLADPAAFAAVHGAASPCGRGPWYNILNPTVSLQMVRDPREHARRRRAWDRAFSGKGQW